MKKFTLLFTIIYFFISCNSDQEMDLDPIIGTWKVISIKSNNKEIFNPDNCDKKHTITFLEKGNAFENNFYIDQTGKCINTERMFKWVNLNNRKYLFDKTEFDLKFSKGNTIYSFILTIKDLNKNDVDYIITHTKV